jgi:hypothetical protein
MIDGEELILNLVKQYESFDFVKNTIEEKNLYLSFITMCFINYLENGHYSDELESLISGNAFIKFKDDIEKNISFKNEPQKALFIEFFESLSTIDESESENEKLKKTLKKSHFLLDPATYDGLNKLSLITIYDHVLQRLQYMNFGDNPPIPFEYQDGPFDFSELITLLSGKEGGHKAYDPFAITGEASVSYAIHNKDVSITTESVLPTSLYIRHKLLLAGTREINSIDPFDFLNIKLIKPEYFDVAYTLFQPNETKGFLNHGKIIKGRYYDDGRVERKIYNEKYKEHSIIQNILKSLKQDGVGFIITGKGPLHREAEKNDRIRLLESNVVDAIIQLPAKLVTSRTVPLYMLILRKDRGTNSNIKFINASSFYEFDGKINKLVNIEKIAVLYSSPLPKNDFYATVNINDIDRESASLTVSSYVSSTDNSYEEIDVYALRSALTKQQKKTDKLFEKLNDFL